jgi:glycerophosphoryl diester phosphodiesterase
LELGTDYIEPDLVATKDGKLIAVHNIDLNITTNIQNVYPDRNKIIEIDGQEISGYFAFDFTLEELSTIRVKQRIQGRSTAFDYQFPIPTLGDILDLLHDWNYNVHPIQNQTKRAGIYVELKYPNYYMDQNVSLADILIEEMKQHDHADEMFFNTKNQTKFGCEERDSYQVPPLVVQSFHSETLHRLSTQFLHYEMALPPFVLLVTEKNCHMPTFWYDVGRLGFLSGVGPDKECLLGDGGQEFMIKSKTFDLAVHPWTTRAEVVFVDSSYATAEDELRWLYCIRGINGMFTENVDLGIIAGIRGCDDFMTAEELFEEDITEVEEKVGGGLNGTISKKICGEGENGNGALRTFGSIATGIAIGILMSFFFSWKFGGGRKGNDDIPSSGISMKTIHRGKMKGMQTLSTADSDPEMEII